MSRNKQAMVRMRIINECLTGGKFRSRQQILDKIREADIHVSSRCFDNDIYLMRNCEQLKYFAPIAYCKIQNAYHYTDPFYSIDKIPLNEKDIEALTIAATTLAQYKYLPLMQEFEVVIDKVIRAVDRVKETDHENLLDFIYFEKTPVASGLEYLDSLIEAIKNKRVINLIYKKFGQFNTTQRHVHPYFLKEYRNRWYLVALDDKSQRIKIFALDRIVRIDDSRIDFQEKLNLDKKDFFENGVGISMMDMPIEKVVLSFSEIQADYVKTQAIHVSQKILQDEIGKDLVVEYNLVINYEFTSIILGYGADVKVIQPQSLAHKIQEIGQQIINLYQNINIAIK